MAILNGKVLFYDPKSQAGTIGDDAASTKRYVFYNADVVSGGPLEKDQLVIFSEESYVSGGAYEYCAKSIQGRPYTAGMVILNGTVSSYESVRAFGVIVDKVASNLNHYIFLLLTWCRGEHYTLGRLSRSLDT